MSHGVLWNISQVQGIGMLPFLVVYGTSMLEKYQGATCLITCDTSENENISWNSSQVLMCDFAVSYLGAYFYAFLVHVVELHPFTTIPLATPLPRHPLISQPPPTSQSVPKPSPDSSLPTPSSSPH